MSADILTNIQNDIHAFSKGQKKIAAYILSNYDKAAFMTASRLGKTVEVSVDGRPLRGGAGLRGLS